MGTMRTAGLLITTLAVAGAGALLAQPPDPEEQQQQRQDNQCPDGDDKVARVEIAVDRAAGKASVSPEEVTIYIGGQQTARRACWVVTGMAEGDLLRFFDKDPTSDDFFPGLSRTVKAAAPFANSGNPSKTGTWVYGVKVTDATGAVVAIVDPVVVIKDGTASGG